MLIDLHGHHLTRGMFNVDPEWGPGWEKGTLRVGQWRLGTKKLPDSHGIKGEATLEQVIEGGAVENRLAAMDRLGVDMLIVSQPAHTYLYWAGEFGKRYSTVVNDELSAYAASAPDRLGFWASAPLAHPQDAARELERAVTELGAVGAMIGGANFGGLEVHSPELDVFWEKACELGVPIMVHGYNQSATWGDRANEDPFDTTSILGMCYDETRAFWNFINGGVLDRFPDLRVYITHAGGFVPYQLERFHQTNITMAPDSVNQKSVLEYMENFYFDPQSHVASMRQAIVDIVGVDRLVYGSNFMGSDQIDFDLTEGIGLSDEDREKIRSGNTIKLLKLDQKAAAAG